jgi:hypothetical protein
MDTKLTLKLDKLIIENAKEYAKEKNISLSKMIENYLQAITNKRKNEIEISPLVKSLTGVIGQQDDNYKKDYTDYLSKKYQ